MLAGKKGGRTEKGERVVLINWSERGGCANRGKGFLVLSFTGCKTAGDGDQCFIETNGGEKKLKDGLERNRKSIARQGKGSGFRGTFLGSNFSLRRDHCEGNAI